MCWIYFYGSFYNLCHVQTGPYDSLKDVALKLVQNKISTVPVILSSTQDGSFPQLLHLASLAGILKCKLITEVLVECMLPITNL